MSNPNPIAAEIARQIGRKAFFMMGTRSRVADGPSLIFDIRGCPEWDKVRVALNGRDLYDVTFYKVGRPPRASIARHVVECVSVDMLHEVIKDVTGLCLSL